MKFSGVILLICIPIKEFTGPLIKVTAGAKGVEITRWVTNQLSYDQKERFLHGNQVIISLYLDPGEGPGSSHSHIFPLVTSSVNGHYSFIVIVMVTSTDHFTNIRLC